MTFDQNIVNALSAPLDAACVKDRTQGGRKLDYIESWHAIAEANRIFGFDGWTRETVELTCISEHERKQGNNPTGKWDVAYRAKVRVTVQGIVREGCGFGQGQNMEIGLAHESALKEAESDAMKRALMTFGNPFGLALYDKDKRNVGNGPPPANGNAQKKAPGSFWEQDSYHIAVPDKDNYKAWAAHYKKGMWNAPSIAALNKFEEDNKAALAHIDAKLSGIAKEIEHVNQQRRAQLVETQQAAE